MIIVEVVKLRVIEGIVIQRLKLLLEVRRFDSSLVDSLSLLSDQLSVFGIAVKLAQPADFTVATLLGSCLLTEVRCKVEFLCLRR